MRVGCGDHLAPEDLADGLMAQADPEDRDLAGQLPDDCHADAGVLGPTRSGEIRMASGVPARMPAMSMASLR